MSDDYDEPTDGDDFFEMDGPGLFDGMDLDDAPADRAPVVTQEPDDGLEDDPADELLLGGADAPVALPGEDSSETGDLSSAEAPSVAGAQTAPSAKAPLQAPQSRHQPRVADEAPAAPLALYRRYRPENFAEVIGQEHVTEPLQRALTNNKVNHAYLFSGPRGCGKTTSARILARCLNCEQGPTPTPCGECQSCRDLARGGSGSIDVIEIDAASHGGVDDARDLRERAFFAPVHSRYKIYIIDEAHMVTAQGFNAMLKLVEEPPPHVKFIFATTEPEKVIGTIRSRTHHYPFRLVPPKVLQNYLAHLCEAEGVAVDHAVLPLVVRAGAGSVRDSLSVLDQLLGGAAEGGVSYEQASALLGYTPDALLDEIMDAFAAGDSAGVFATIDKVIEVGQDPRRFAEDLLRRLRDLVIVAAVPDAVASGLIDVSGDQAERLQTQANGMGPGELTRAAEVIASGLTDMRGTTAPRLHLELMCSRVLLPGADVDGRGIHARLDRLERRMGMPGTPLPPDPNAGSWSDEDLGGSGLPGGQPAGPAAARQAVKAAMAPQQSPASHQPAPHQPAPQQAVGQQPAPQEGMAASSGAPQTPGVQIAVPGGAPMATHVEAVGQSVQQAASASGAQRAPGAGAQQAPAQGPASRQQAVQGDSAQPPASQSQPQVPQPQAPQSQAAQPPAPQGTGGQRPAGAPLGQRPAGQRPAGQRAPQGQAPASQSTAQQQAAQAGAPSAAAARAAGGSIQVADVRRLWPQVLDEVKSRRRFAWILLSQNAQVVDVSDGQLVLGFSNAGARDRFASGGSQDVLRDCMIEVMGADLRIEAILEAGGHPGQASGGATGGRSSQPVAPAGGAAGQQTPTSPQAGGTSAHEPQQGGSADPGASASVPSQWQPQRPSGESEGDSGGAPEQPRPTPVAAHGDSDDPGPRTPPSAPEPPEDHHPETSRWTEQARQNIRPTASGPSAPEAEVDESQLVSDDDESLDESSESAAELIARALGGVVIAEEEAGS